MEALQAQLSRIVFLFWQVPPREGRVLVRVLRTSSCARVATLRHQLTLLRAVYPTVQGWREVDGAHMYSERLTPQFVVQMLGDLRAAGQLTAVQVRVIERALLACVDREGQWRAIEE